MIDSITPTYWLWVGGFAILVFGFWAGHIHSYHTRRKNDPQWFRETFRAQEMIESIDRVTDRVQHQLSSHRRQMNRFRHRLKQIESEPDELVWVQLCQEAKALLQPTEELATELADAYDHLRQQSKRLDSLTDARTDSLTQVSNRLAFDEELNSSVERLKRYQTPFSLCILDIDHFKKFNDEHGHLFGDEVLRQISKLLSENSRQNDFVGRYGGEEFVLILPETSLPKASLIIDRFREMAQTNLSITFSAGLSEALIGDPPELIVARADEALYTAKNAGRNRVFWHDGQDIRPFPVEDSFTKGSDTDVDPNELLHERRETR
jgi:diguanylate cyclase